MSDLPTTGSPVTNDGTPTLIEAIGVGPDSEVTVTSVYLYATDQHSDATVEDPLQTKTDGTRIYSTERWLSLRVMPPFDSVTDFRFWIDNYAPNDGWILLWGESPTYMAPKNSKSLIATGSIPTADPGADNPNVNSTQQYGITGTPGYSGWIVLQASWNGSGSDSMQSAPLNLSFAWTED